MTYMERMLANEIAALRRQNEMLRAALEKFATHNLACAWFDETPDPCDCGLHAVFASLDAQPREEMES